LQALLQSDEAQKLLPRKYLITGGEALTPKLVEKITSLNPQCEVINHYGPTETTVGSLTLKLKDYDWKRAGLTSIPIGRPIATKPATCITPAKLIMTHCAHTSSSSYPTTWCRRQSLCSPNCR